MSIVTELDLLRYRRTKIVATVGPASASPDSIARLINAGVNVFRVNMSHGEHATHRQVIASIREQAQKLGLHIGVLADLCGPKIRTGKFVDGKVELVTGSEVIVTVRDVMGSASCVPSQYDALPNDVSSGDRILLNDGAAELRVDSISNEDVACTVVSGGPIGDHKGINLPGVNVSAPCLTDKDRVDLAFALGEQVDFLALSFVRQASDIELLREIIGHGADVPSIIAKIEKPEALQNHGAILAAADGIMVARGDLGVELNPEQVPIAQHQLIRDANKAGKPVIVATQMLESMINQARPTRAEVTDVAHAVADGTDAVMLSGETAVGRHPIEAVEMMDRVTRQTESYHWHTQTSTVQTAFGSSAVPFGAALAAATARLVRDVQARAVLVISQQGVTAATVSAARPAAPVVAISGDSTTCRRMSLMWGVVPHLDLRAGRENPTSVARRVARELNLARSGENVVLVRGFNPDRVLNTPTVTLLEV